MLFADLEFMALAPSPYLNVYTNDVVFADLMAFRNFVLKLDCDWLPEIR